MADKKTNGSATRIRDLFSQARELPEGPQREQFLDEACGGDAPLRQEVESLLTAHAAAGGFLNNDGVGAPIEPFGDKVGMLIGRYRLVEHIGEGGFGEVYRAEQTEPLKREVALKIIKLGMDTKEVIARFEAERQALALMDHPNIARVFDAGATETGRPYFVMELACGEPITDYCDSQRMSLDERLKLFQQVCIAVQHAHQKGIIHRDLKPSNIVVTLRDGQPVPKIIDFGIAKLLRGRLTDRKVVTQREVLLGTPAYMSPEQVEVASEDLDTRTDIYSLGVLLYELVAGVTPIEDETLRQAAFVEVQRIIREVDPPKPSTRLHTLGAKATEIAGRRNIEPLVLERRLRGDLDWIVMKAIERDRQRRYEAASTLAQDVQHHLNHEPVLAGPPTSIYRVSKFIRRNKTAIAVAASMLLLLAAGALVSTLQMVKAGRAERIAKAEASKASAVSGLMLELLSSANPYELKGSEYTVRQLLDDFSADISEKLAGQPDVEAAVRHKIGRAYSELWMSEKAVPHMEQSLALLRRLHPSDSQLVITRLLDCAWAWHYGESEDVTIEMRWEKARPYLREVQETCRRQGYVGREKLIAALGIEQWFMMELGQYPEAEAAGEEALAIAEMPPKIQSAWQGNILNTLAMVRYYQGRHEEAERLAEKALHIHRRLCPPRALEIGWSLQALGTSYFAQNKLPEARVTCEEALKIFIRQYRYEHKSVKVCTDTLRRTLESQQDWPALEALLNRILEGQRAFLLESDPDGGREDVHVAVTLLRLADAAAARDRTQEAERYEEDANQIVSDLVERLVDGEGSRKSDLLGEDNPDVADSLAVLAEILKERGRLTEADTLQREAIALLGEAEDKQGYGYESRLRLFESNSPYRQP